MNSFQQKCHLTGGYHAPISWLYRLFERISKAFSCSRFLVHGAGKIRRFYLGHFRKEYVKRQLLIREGECRQCGTCCNLLNTCPMLTSGGRCFAYGSCRPQACKVFPIDERDIAEVKMCGKSCGFRFAKNRITN